MLIVDKAQGDPKTVFVSTNSKLSDVVGAISAGLSVVSDSNKVITVKTKPDEILKLAANKYSNYDDYRHFGMSFTNAETFATKFSNAKVDFRTRTFEGILNSIATEEGQFRWMTSNNNFTNSIDFKTDACGPIAAVTWTNDCQCVCHFTNRPIMRIAYTGKERSGLSKLIEVEYKNSIYTVGDFTNGLEDVFPDDTDQNRAVFTMLSYLFSQTAIDTAKLPVQQLIQVQ